MMSIDFNTAFSRITSRGWLSRKEGEALYNLALTCRGPIVEVGSFCGRSTMLLLQTGNHIVSVDPWDDTFHSELRGEEIYSIFLSNVEEIKRVMPLVRHTICRTRVEGWAPIKASLVYLDGDHTYEGTWNQIEKAWECDPDVIAVHDYATKGGGLEVKRACDESLFKPSQVIETLAIWNKHYPKSRERHALAAKSSPKG